MEKRRLGRGLDALLGNQPTTKEPDMHQSFQVPLHQIQPNPHQPRKEFDEEELAHLSQSIRSHGILQPLVVRRQNGSYQLIAGERRLRAAREAGLASVPVRVLDFNDQQVLEAALIENLQRTDLNPIEKAVGFADYLERYQMKHDELADRLGLARSTITNLVHLLDLPADVQDGIRQGQISEGHAKHLRSIKPPEKQVSIFKKIVALGLSVKATEELVRDARIEAEQADAGDEPRAREPAIEKTSHLRGLEDELRQRFATGVEIRLKDKDRGHIILRFDSNDDFERIVQILRR
jgi:ParB family transcriptional regulator, chromosome partitioning protein